MEVFSVIVIILIVLIVIALIVLAITEKKKHNEMNDEIDRVNTLIKKEIDDKIQKENDEKENIEYFHQRGYIVFVNRVGEKVIGKHVLEDKRGRQLNMSSLTDIFGFHRKGSDRYIISTSGFYYEQNNIHFVPDNSVSEDEFNMATTNIACILLENGDIFVPGEEIQGIANTVAVKENCNSKDMIPFNKLELKTYPLTLPYHPKNEEESKRNKYEIDLQDLRREQESKKETIALTEINGFKPGYKRYWMSLSNVLCKKL